MTESNPFARLDPFLDELKSDAPTPGGGAVAGLLGALAAALAHMVASLTVGKKKYAAVDAEFRSAMPEMSAAIKRFRDLIEEDVLVFNNYMAALKLPKSSDTEKAHRKSAILVAVREAARVPMAALEESAQIIPLIELAADQGNKHAISDAGIAAILCSSAARAAAMNVRINLASLPADEAKTIAGRLEGILDRVQTDCARIEAEVNAAL